MAHPSWFYRHEWANRTGLTKDLWIPLLLALVTYLLTYSNSVRMETRKLRLQHLNDQLQILYGPLFSLSHASAQAWGELHIDLRPSKTIALTDPAHPLEAFERRLQPLR